jgi:2Fe-2S iron-sulfur cluster binding domain
MSEVFRPFERLVEITVLGKTLQVPEKNTLLRAFQYISPETIPYGRFCWNQECQYCRVTCQLPDDDEARPMLSCKFLVVPGMVVTELAPELVWCLRGKLNAAPSPQGNGSSPSHSVPGATAESNTTAGTED